MKRVLVGLLAVSVVSAVLSIQTRAQDPWAATKKRPDSTSIGQPNAGKLRYPVSIPLRAPGMIRTKTNNALGHFATKELVAAVREAAKRVHNEFGGLPLVVRDASLPKGGPIPHHRSHQAGRDVDLYFYQLDAKGKQRQPVGAFFDAAGEGIDFKKLDDPSDDILLRIDEPRTWLLIQALIENKHAPVQQIFIASHLKARLLRYAESVQAPLVVRQRFAQVTCQPGAPHDDHIHVRFYCSVDDIAAGCRDGIPMFAWQADALKQAGVAPLAYVPVAKPSRTVSVEEAKAAAGTMDPLVVTWLNRRDAWIAQPDPAEGECKVNNVREE